jgi:N-acetylglucosamine kinase-like BadF-type ATPase
MRFISGGRGSSTILRADDENFDALGDQSFDIGLLRGGVALAEEDLDGVARRLEGVAEAGLILDPAGLILGGQNHTH